LSIFSPTAYLNKGFDLMIKHSTCRSTIRLTNPSALTRLASPVEKEYRELLDQREQVRDASPAIPVVPNGRAPMAAAKDAFQRNQ
jgi:hypothetical protein